MLPALLNPTTVFRVLEDIDRTPPSHTAPREEGAKVALVVLFSVAIALHLLNYLKNSVALDGILIQLALWRDMDPQHYLQILRSGYWDQLIRYAWWTAWHVITFVMIPFVIIRFFLKKRFRDFGWGWGETHKHWQGYCLLLSPILVGVVLVSFRDDFKTHYPFYDIAGRSILDFVAWEALYLTQFACLEFFFRGYLVQSLRPYYGSAAIWIMVVPYLMIHFPKPWIEATGAIFFGLFLGILALRSRSIWGGFFVHAGVAVSMDIMSLVQRHELPKVLLPF